MFYILDIKAPNTSLIIFFMKNKSFQDNVEDYRAKFKIMKENILITREGVPITAIEFEGVEEPTFHEYEGKIRK